MSIYQNVDKSAVDIGGLYCTCKLLLGGMRARTIWNKQGQKRKRRRITTKEISIRQTGRAYAAKSWYRSIKYGKGNKIASSR